MLNSLKENENKRGRSNEKHDSEVKVSVVRMKPIRPQSMVGREFGYK